MEMVEINNNKNDIIQVEKLYSLEQNISSIRDELSLVKHQLIWAVASGFM